MSEKMYSLMSIKYSSGRYFYVATKDSSTGAYSSKKSVDAIAKKIGCFHHITSKPEAVSIVEKAMKKGILGEFAEQTAPMTVEKYLRDFWDYDNSLYIKMKNSGKKIRIHKNYVKANIRSLELHVFPYLPKRILVSQLQTRHLEKVQRAYLKNHSSKGWSNILNAIALPFNELVRKNIIDRSPVTALDRIPIDSRERDCLTYDEVTQLVHQIRADIESNKIAKRHGLGIILAFCTGMRQGEIRGLHARNIEVFDLSDMAIIHVVESYSDVDGFKSTKNGKGRDVTIPKSLALELLEVAKENSHEDDLVFYGRYKDTPLTPKSFNDPLFDALDKIGINKEERERRFISFHTSRHFVNSELRTRIGGEMAMEIVGHSSQAMSLHYDHTSNRRALEIGQKVGDLFSFVEAL